MNDELYFTATTCQLDSRGLPQLCLGKYNDLKNGYMLVDKLTLLKGPDPDRVEKNWLPFVIDDQLFVIYSRDPYIIYKVDIETGDCQIYLKKQYDADFSQLRGSCCADTF